VTNVIKKIWLLPPLAFARLGPSENACDNYSWAPDHDPSGTGKTTLRAEPTLHINPSDATLTEDKPNAIAFKENGVGFRPVCPFFELHGEWTDGPRGGGPITTSVLAQCGRTLADVVWTVTVANLKAHHYTLKDGDRISAHVRARGDHHTREELKGISPDGAQPLVPKGSHVPLGWVQVPRPDDKFPECRLRVTPPKGLVYAPTDFNQRMIELKDRAPKAGGVSHTRWQSLSGAAFELPATQCLLNPKAAWPQWTPPPKEFPLALLRAARDFRTIPAQLFAYDDTVKNEKEEDAFNSLGLVDDISDGFVQCSLGTLTAVARVVVAPPDFAPDRRPLVSIADGLKDRVDRKEVVTKEFVADGTPTTEEVRDLLERVFETQGLMNLDALNDHFLQRNMGTAQGRAVQLPDLASKLFPRLPVLDDRPLPLTELGRQRHRRMLSLEVLEDRLREDPTLIHRFLRAPLSGDPYYDQKMPALIRGSDSHPMHLSRRQYDMLIAWARGLQRSVKGNP
jgi:hypothetical protein